MILMFFFFLLVLNKLNKIINKFHNVISCTQVYIKYILMHNTKSKYVSTMIYRMCIMNLAEWKNTIVQINPMCIIEIFWEKLDVGTTIIVISSYYAYKG